MCLQHTESIEFLFQLIPVLERSDCGIFKDVTSNLSNFFITLKYFSEIEIFSPICQSIASRIKLAVICQNI